jgi:hypothetical protein
MFERWVMVEERPMGWYRATTRHSHLMNFIYFGSVGRHALENGGTQGRSEATNEFSNILINDMTLIIILL